MERIEERRGAVYQRPMSPPTAVPHPPESIDALPFETALAELEQIVTRLERGDVPLEESIAIYERGEKLKAHCDRLLGRAEMRIETITRGSDGTPSGTRPLDVED